MTPPSTPAREGGPAGGNAGVRLATPARRTSPTAHREDHLAIGIGEEGKRVVAQGRRDPTRSAQSTLSWGGGREEPLGRLDGLTPPLTASEALDLTGIAAVASDLTGRPITRVTVTDEEWRAGLISHGVPEPQAGMFLGLFLASRQGEFAAVDPTLERLLGRPPMSMRDVLPGPPSRLPRTAEAAPVAP